MKAASYSLYSKRLLSICSCVHNPRACTYIPWVCQLYMESVRVKFGILSCSIIHDIASIIILALTLVSHSYWLLVWDQSASHLGGHIHNLELQLQVYILYHCLEVELTQKGSVTSHTPRLESSFLSSGICQGEPFCSLDLDSCPLLSVVEARATIVLESNINNSTTLPHQ